ncbi:MAG: PDZ domain-containing protein, partial [Candidatus Kapaibacteriota bacterium]
EGRMQEIHHVVLHHDQHAGPAVSTQLSEVVPPSERGVVLGALNYDILADSPLEIGNHLVRTFDVQGARHELAVASSQPVDIDWLAEQIRVIVNTEAAIFGSVPYDRYVFILQCYPNSYGGLEHARSSVNAVDPQALLETSKAKGLLALLCHEYFHLWNVKRIRPVELGPFDYTKENYTPMLWLAEGVTSYYDDLLSYRCGFLTQDEYLNTLSSEHLTRLMLVPGRFRMSTRDSSFLSWVKLYLQSPDGNNRFPSYYLKGGVVTMLLDLYIIDHTDGRTSLDDGLRGLWERYLQDPSRGLTEDECIAILERSTGVQLRDRLMQWLNGTTELPYAELLEPLGLKLLVEAETAPAITFGENRSFASVPAIRFTGLTVAESSGKVLVKGVLDGSPGQRAGIGIDDELVALDGTRVTGTKQMDQILAAAGDREVLVTAQCDGVVYSTTMSTAPVMKARLQKMDTMTSRQQQLFDRWLRRP